MKARLLRLVESVRFALHALSVNGLRTMLSLLGVTIGIFAIIAVYAAVDSLEANIRDSVSSLGDRVIYVQKWSWGGSGEYPWWKFWQRREPGYRDFKELSRREFGQEALVFGMSLNGTAKFGSSSVENVGVLGATHDYQRVWEVKLGQGRYFTESESNRGPMMAVIGHDIAEGLFAGQSPIGKEVAILGRKFLVIGVFEKVGQSMVGGNQDELFLVPANALRKLVNAETTEGNMIMAMARPDVEMDAFRENLRGAMRSVRRLKPRTEDDFSLNEISIISGQLDQIFSMLTITGTVIGMFSLLVGGFGIANIMFVSVRERTNQIGIQKALGAKRRFILSQFIAEAILLCMLGGAIGIGLVGIGVLLANAFTDFSFILSWKNMAQGFGISAAIGLISGLVPALMAARMDPVEAIRQGG
ncbi:FtsX-like permease family protein [bacterium]|nr:FtsX-like permease family protein [bacterium]